MHPAARILTDIARSQDAEVGDGTTSVVVLAGEILKEVRDLVEQGVSSQTIIKGLRRASAMAVNKVKEIAVDMIDSSVTAGEEDRDTKTVSCYSHEQQAHQAESGLFHQRVSTLDRNSPEELRTLTIVVL